MNRVRKLNPSPPKRAAAGPTQWLQLLRKTIERAQKANDPRLPALQRAMQDGSGEKVLRRMSIICDADIDREFPASVT